MKIAVIGGAPARASELVEGMIGRIERLGFREFWYNDTDPSRLEVVGRVMAPVVKRRGGPLHVRLSLDRRAALAGADFVVLWLDVGGPEAREEDLRLCSRWRLIGQATNGIGVMSCALRTIPAILSIAEDMRACCPGAWLINLSSPVGIVMEALQRKAVDLRTVGLSGGPVGYQSMVAEMLGLDDPFMVHLDYLGLNQVAWIRGACVGGRSVWRQVAGEDDPERSEDVVVRVGMVWDYFLGDRGLDHLPCEQDGPGTLRSGRTRAVGEEPKCRETIGHAEDPPHESMKRASANLPAAAVRLIESMASDSGGEQIVNTSQRGAVEGIPGDWILELPCRVSRDRIDPLPSKPLPEPAGSLLRIVKSFERLCVEAACTGDRAVALAALLAHPLGPDVDHADGLLEDMLETNRAHLPPFHGSGVRA